MFCIKMQLMTKIVTFLIIYLQLNANDIIQIAITKEHVYRLIVCRVGVEITSYHCLIKKKTDLFYLFIYLFIFEKSSNSYFYDIFDKWWVFALRFILKDIIRRFLCYAFTLLSKMNISYSMYILFVISYKKIVTKVFEEK